MTTPNPRLVALNIGTPKFLGTKPDGSPFISSIARQTVSGPIKLGPGGFEGDSCHWHEHHVMPLAVNAFALEDYPYFERLGGKQLPRPAFGENLTLEGYTDRQARLGDILRIGSALLQVSQPRVPCGNLVRFLELPKIIKWMEESQRTGFYLRVLETGEIAPDSEIRLVEQGDTGWTIAALSEFMYSKTMDPEVIEELESLEVLSPNWKSSLIWRARRVHALASKSGTRP